MLFVMIEVINKHVYTCCTCVISPLNDALAASDVRRKSHFVEKNCLLLRLVGNEEAVLTRASQVKRVPEIEK